MSATEELICNRSECTLAQTGECILGNDPTTCVDRLKSLEYLEEPSVLELIGSSVLESPTELERFPGSYTLSTDYCEELMRSRYCKVVGILGVPGTGKTASLVSLYLLLSHSKLSGFEFRDSKSIMAFEEISRGARKWSKGNLPEQLTVHTELQDERQAGFLHLRLHYTNQNVATDLLLTDIPGEWTTSLIDSNRIDRLNFLKSSDRIWIMLNGEEVADAETRQHTIHRLKILVDRISILLAPYIPDLTIVITHCDTNEGVKKHLATFLSKYPSINIKVFEIASFSSNDEIPPGTGLSELVEDLLVIRNEKKTSPWLESETIDGMRQMLKYKHI